MRWLLNLFKPSQTVFVNVTAGKVEAPEDHQRLVARMDALNREDGRNVPLRPVCVFVGKEPNFWDKEKWDLPEPHSIWLWLWVERKKGRTGLFDIVDVSAVMDVWNKDGRLSLEFARMDGNNKDPIEFSVDGKVVAKVYDRYLAVEGLR